MPRREVVDDIGDAWPQRTVKGLLEVGDDFVAGQVGKLPDVPSIRSRGERVRRRYPGDDDQGVRQAQRHTCQPVPHLVVSDAFEGIHGDEDVPTPAPLRPAADEGVVDG